MQRNQQNYAQEIHPNPQQQQPYPLVYPPPASQPNMPPNEYPYYYMGGPYSQQQQSPQPPVQQYTYQQQQQQHQYPSQQPPPIQQFVQPQLIPPPAPNHPSLPSNTSAPPTNNLTSSAPPSIITSSPNSSGSHTRYSHQIKQIPQAPTRLPPSLSAISGPNSFLHNGNYKFVLEVAQQPIRARMCGFGDKDRRQITPPPCVRLRIFNIHTNQEFTDIASIDTSFYALLGELWSVDMTTNMSLVHPSGQIYQAQHHQQQQYPTSSTYPNSNPYPNSPYDYNRQAYAGMPPSNAPSTQTSSHIVPHPPSTSNPPMASSSGSSSGIATTPPTRNLIGSLVATAYKLHDLDDNLGIWFIFQDLSVRTEGEFRLKFSFVNLAEAVSNLPLPNMQMSSPVPSSNAISSASHQNPTATNPSTLNATENKHAYTNSSSHSPNLSSGPAQSSSLSGSNTSNSGSGGLDTNSASILASIFSNPFRSYSAKKFPGVIDSTELSRKFATQGIKIPIRREHKSKEKKQNQQQQQQQQQQQIPPGMPSQVIGFPMGMPSNPPPPPGSGMGLMR